MSKIHPKIRAFSVLVVGVLLVVAFLSRLDSSHSLARAQPQTHEVTVERIPSSEAKSMGLDARNH